MPRCFFRLHLLILLSSNLGCRFQTQCYYQSIYIGIYNAKTVQLDEAWMVNFTVGILSPGCAMVSQALPLDFISIPILGSPVGSSGIFDTKKDLHLLFTHWAIV